LTMVLAPNGVKKWNIEHIKEWKKE
jgi:hypothetical protein